jgi:hypothetical protein
MMVSEWRVVVLKIMANGWRMVLKMMMMIE